MKFLSTLLLLVFCLTGFTLPLHAQELTIDLRHVPVPAAPVSLPMQATNPSGETLSVNSQYFERNGKPWFPLMGEMHYNRVPPDAWERSIQEMKSAGLSIIATYVFWNEHEPEKGVWDWKGNRDLRHFIELCKKNNMLVWLRIGPWSHGEQLNGGFPEWIENMKGKRTNDPAYLAEATKLFNQIGDQTKDLYFKDGGPIIGAQLENEYASGQPEHISMLKKIALSANIHPVYWSVTANTVFDENKLSVIPLQGAYPYRGWEKAGGGPTRDFLYADDNWILTGSLGKVYYDITKFPKGFCELGAGSQMTYSNRFVVDPNVIEALLQNEIGRGVNMIGYYMFQGGTQTRGLKEPGLPESYDFQAPISEFGLIRKSYKDLKILHNFINDFGSDLAPMQVVESANPIRDPFDTTDLRYIARVKDNTGFLFLCNTQPHVHMPDKQVTMKVKLPDETITFPSVLLKGQTTAILPFNLNINNALLKYATVQPLARINKGKEQFVFFTEVPGMDVELAFDSATVQSLSAKNWKKEAADEKIILTFEGKDADPIKIISATGQRATLILLTRQQAENSWRIKIKNQERLIISKSDLMSYDNSIECRQLDDPNISFNVFPAIKNKVFFKGKEIFPIKKGIFQHYVINQPKVFPKVKLTRSSEDKMVVQMPGYLPPGLSDVILKIDYLGGSAEALIGGKIATDNLFNGTDWMFSLKRYLKLKQLPKEGIEFHVLPWSNNITGVPDSLVDIIKSGPKIRSVKIVPQYRAEVRIE